MTIGSFLSTYWSYITTAGLGFWNIYLQRNSIRAKRKGELKETYLQLTGIVNDFQVNMLKFFLIEPELIELELGVYENMTQANNLIEKVKNFNLEALGTKGGDLNETLKRLCGQYKLVVDSDTKIKVADEIQLKIDESNLLVKELDIIRSILNEAKEISQIVNEKMLTYMGSGTPRIIAFSTVITDFIKKINSTPSWQLIGSKRVINTVIELQSASLELNSLLLTLKEPSMKNPPRFNKKILESSVFQSVFDLSDDAIQKMRTEL